MIEKLIPLNFPPGLSNSGTVYQSKGRWHSGNCVRFYQGNIDPIGGWIQRTLTGSAILGTPNAAVSWQTNDGTSYLAIGTTSNLYVVTVDNVVHDITPTDATWAASLGVVKHWSLEVFGSYLVAAFNGTQSDGNNFYVWTGSLSDVAMQPGATLFDSPTGVFGVAVTPERFLVVLRGRDPASMTVPSGAFQPP